LYLICYERTAVSTHVSYNEMRRRGGEAIPNYQRILKLASDSYGYRYSDEFMASFVFL